MRASMLPFPACLLASPLPQGPVATESCSCNRHPSKEYSTVCGIASAIASNHVVPVLVEGLRKGTGIDKSRALVKSVIVE